MKPGSDPMKQRADASVIYRMIYLQHLCCLSCSEHGVSGLTETSDRVQVKLRLRRRRRATAIRQKLLGDEVVHVEFLMRSHVGDRLACEDPGAADQLASVGEGQERLPPPWRRFVEEGRGVGDCVGLVGAEVLLAIFQVLFSMLTIYLAIKLRKIKADATEFRSNAKGFTGRENALMCSCGIALSVYMIIAWNTALNRRCPQNTHQWLLPIQHHFYPVFLLVDLVATSDMYVTTKAILAHSQSGHSAQSSNKKLTNAILKMAATNKFLCIVTLCGCTLGCCIFLLQFTAQIKALSLVACVFCVLMYITYAIRRIILLAMWCRFDLKTRTFASVAPSTNANRTSCDATSALASKLSPA